MGWKLQSCPAKSVMKASDDFISALNQLRFQQCQQMLKMDESKGQCTSQMHDRCSLPPVEAWTYRWCPFRTTIRTRSPHQCWSIPEVDCLIIVSLIRSLLKSTQWMNLMCSALLYPFVWKPYSSNAQTTVSRPLRWCAERSPSPKNN